MQSVTVRLKTQSRLIVLEQIFHYIIAQFYGEGIVGNLQETIYYIVKITKFNNSS